MLRAGTAALRRAVFAVATGDGAELQGRFVIVPSVFN